jgi:hypothetical protein
MDEIKTPTQKEILQKRLIELEKMKFNHEQDVRELGFVIEGLKAQIDSITDC